MNDENGIQGNNASSTKASSPDMDEYELVGKGSNGDEDDLDQTHYTTGNCTIYS